MSHQVHHAAPFAAAGAQPSHAREPWRESAESLAQHARPLPARWFALMLEEVGHGMLLLGSGARVLHANHQARAELAIEHPLRLQGAELHARNYRDQLTLQGALVAAARGLRRMVMVGEGCSRASVAFVPLDGTPGDGLTLVLLGLRSLSPQLTVHGFARSHELTAAETRVLEQLCAGSKPSEIAAAHGVTIATVRTQVASIRHKTGAGDINALVRLVALLPPMVAVLRPAPAPVEADDRVPCFA